MSFFSDQARNVKSWLRSRSLAEFDADGATGQPVCRFRVGDEVLHTKSGGVYRIVLTPARLCVERTREPAYIYELATKSPDVICYLWVRPKTEMEDGRFVLVRTFNTETTNE